MTCQFLFITSYHKAPEHLEITAYLHRTLSDTLAYFLKFNGGCCHYLDDHEQDIYFTILPFVPKKKEGHMPFEQHLTNDDFIFIYF